MTTFAPAKNLAYALIDGGITAVATSFNVVGGGSKFPNPAIDGNFSGTIWNVTDYESAHLDPNAEIVIVTGRSTNAFTVTRGAESTSGVAHNTTGKTYAIALTFTAGGYDAITAAINARAEITGWTASRVIITSGAGALGVSTVTATELGYLSGVTSAIQTQLNAKASGSGYTASRVMISDGTGALVVSPDITTTELGYLNGATGTTGTGNLVFSASPTFTGTVTVAALYAGAGTFTDRIQVSGNISFPGAASGNGYIYHANNLGLVIYGEGTSLDLLFANKSGGTVMSVTTNTQNVDFAGAVNVVSNVTIGGQATATSVGLEIGNTAGGTPFIDFKSSAIDYDVRIINGAANTLSFLGASAGYFFDATVNSIYSIIATTATATLTTITQGITIAGNLVTSAYLSDGYTAGLTWSNTDDNASKPKAGIFSRTTAGGSYIVLGTSSSYATGINSYVNIDYTGGVQTGGKVQVGTTAPTASSGAAFTVNTDLTTGSAGSGSLVIQGASNKERIKIYSAGGAGTGGPLFNMFSFRGSIASPTATQNGDLLSGVSGGGYGATGYTGNKYVFLQYATENWTDSAQGCYTALNSTANGSTSNTARLLIDHNGTITLGSVFGTGTGELYAGAGTFTGLLTTVASASGGAGFRAPHGAAPSSPTNGDFWTTTAGAYIRINGVTKTFTLT